MKKEDGVISLVVLFMMIFLLIFTLTIYSIVKDKNKLQDSKDLELYHIYSKNENEINENLYAENDIIIPIYNINDLKIAGTGAYSEIEGKIYQCSSKRNYELKNNIIIDVNEDLNSVNIGFNDYKFYSNNYYIDKSLYDCYYFYNNSYWKVIAYQKFEKDKTEELVNNDIYENNKFSILKKFNFKSTELEFLNIIKNEKGEISGIYQEIQSQIPKSLNEIKVFENHFNELDTEKGEFYLLTKYNFK